MIQSITNQDHKAHARLNHFGEEVWVHHAIGLKTTSKSVENHQYIHIMPLKSV